MERRLVIALWFAAVLSALGAEPLSAPRLISPPDKMEITDVATYFQWVGIPGCTNFEIQIATDSGFQKIYKQKQTVNKGYHKNLYFPKDLLPVGDYFWRVRGVLKNAAGPWSAARRLKVNAEHPVAAETVRTISAAAPIFMMRNRAWDPFKNPKQAAELIPPGLEQVIVVDDGKLATENVFERAKQYEALGVDFVIWNNRCQVSLATLEYLFQNFKHCLGTAEGEHFSGMYWERGPEGNLAECDFVHRAWTLCGKYGRFYFFADGDGGSFRWPGFAEREKEILGRYRKNIVLMFKTTNGDLALHSYGAVQGLMASGYVEHCGTWMDEWIWPCCGFGKLGEIIPKDQVWANRRKVGTKQCPWVYDIQLWLMGIAAGSTTFHLESAHQWTPEGKRTPHYQRVFLPFIKAVVERQLIPSRQAFLEQIKVAVAGNLELAKGKHEKQYTGAFAYLKDLYAVKAPGDQDVLPNDSRYGILCLLPPGAHCLNPRTQVVPQEQLLAPGKAREIFERAYPQRFTGDAFMWECDGTVIITDSNENQDISQRYEMPWASGLVRGLKGTVGVHQYIIGKFSKGGESFWFQANTEYPDRTTDIVLKCARKPQCKISPASAAASAHWDEASQSLSLRLAHAAGAVEVELQ